MKTNWRNKRVAYLHFFPECNGKARTGWVLHHKNTSLKTEDPERYEAWIIEDLIPMTITEHVRLHRLGKELSDEQKKKISEAHRGKPAWNSGKHLSEETKKKISEALKEKPTWAKGQHFSDEHRNKLSEAHKGEDNGMYGKHHSEDTKRKMSEAKKGKDNGRSGKHHSEETKKKIAEARKRYWQSLK